MSITDEWLRFHAAHSWISFDGRVYDEPAALAAELLNARAEIERLKAEYDGMPTYNAVCQQMHDTEQELAAACAEIERLKGNANLGLATTQELLEELMARARTGGYDQYKTLNLEGAT